MCALVSTGCPPTAPSKVLLQGPHYAEGQVRGASVSAAFQVPLTQAERELLDLALVRVWQGSKELVVDLVVSIDRSCTDDSSSEGSAGSDGAGQLQDHPIMLFGSRPPAAFRAFTLFKLDEVSVACQDPAEAVLNWSSQERSLQIFTTDSLEYASLCFKPVLSAFKRCIEQGVDLDLGDPADRIRFQKFGLSEQLQKANSRVVLDEGQLLELECRGQVEVKAIKLRQKPPVSTALGASAASSLATSRQLVEAIQKAEISRQVEEESKGESAPEIDLGKQALGEDATIEELKSFGGQVLKYSQARYGGIEALLAERLDTISENS